MRTSGVSLLQSFGRPAYRGGNTAPCMHNRLLTRRYRETPGVAACRRRLPFSNVRSASVGQLSWLKPFFCLRVSSVASIRRVGVVVGLHEIDGFKRYGKQLVAHAHETAERHGRVLDASLIADHKVIDRADVVVSTEAANVHADQFARFDDSSGVIGTIPGRVLLHRPADSLRRLPDDLGPRSRYLAADRDDRKQSQRSSRGSTRSFSLTWL